MQQFHLGPILFREECIFKKEIHLQDTVMIDLILKKGNRDISRWSIQHRVLKNDNILSAIITVDGAWIDTSKRKLTVKYKKKLVTIAGNNTTRRRTNGSTQING